MNSNRRLALFLLAGSALLQGAEAAQFGAIAWSRQSGHHGYGYNYPTAVEAEGRAIAECHRKGANDCSVVLSLNDGCGALAVGEETGYGAIGMDQPTAERRALEGCKRQESKCRLVRSFCSGVATAVKPAAAPHEPLPEAARRVPEPPPMGIELPEDIPKALKAEAGRLIDEVRHGFDGTRTVYLIVSFVALIVFFRFVRGIFRLGKRLPELFPPTAVGRPKPGGPDWILDRRPTPAATKAPVKPRPSRETVGGAILDREAGPVVWDMNRSRRLVREKR